MLKTFGLFDGSLGRQVGALRYDVDHKAFSMTIDGDVPLADLPLSLEIFAGSGVLELNHRDVLEWIRGRICPPGRQNIVSILDELGLPEYDEFGILMSTMARCDKDELYLRDV
jgi:hypothetical protein